MTQFPAIGTSEPKELDFFSSYYDRGYEWYERHFDRSPGRTLFGEVSPSYFIDADAPHRAHLYNPQMRIVATLRDPVERAYSNHLHEVRAGHVSGDNLIFENAIKNNPLYVEQGFYASHLGRWLNVFPRHQVHVIFQENVRTDSMGATRELADFLSLDMPVQIVNRRANESMDYRNRALGMSFWRLGKLARRAGMGGAVEQIKSMPVIREFRHANQIDLRQAVASMTDACRAELIDRFRPEVEALETLLGRKAPWKNFA